MSTNVSTTFITCPGDLTKTLGIKLPFLVMLIKNLKKYFSFEVQVLDDKNVRRRFRASNYQVCLHLSPPDDLTRIPKTMKNVMGFETAMQRTCCCSDCHCLHAHVS
jgi:hypothetical protein